ncbi:STAS domain-containing protein [Streptomyces sp. NPDC059063]|uniref:STAS domain-containing protein n=1 Tax=unclassified Streptomyces TaxID=2593676 RepID=UPI00368019EB
MAAVSPQHLHVDIVSGLDPALVRVRGDLDLESAPLLRTALAPLLHRRVELDLADVAFMDSSGINALVVHHRRSRDAGGHLGVIAISRAVERVLHITGVDALLVSSRAPDEPGGRPETDPP